MDNFEKELDVLDLIRSYCLINLDDSIENIKCEVAGQVKSSRLLDSLDEYDYLSVEDFLMLYKIDRLESLDIISEEKANHLKELLTRRNFLKREMAAIEYALEVVYNENIENAIEIVDNKAVEISQELQEINAKLQEYHLIGVFRRLFDFQGIIDNMISSEIYLEKENTK